MRRIPESELIINQDGSIFHLHLKPEDIADTIILVGDQDRVEVVSSFFDTIEVKKQNREFITHTGTFHGKRITVTSTGIGTDNIDIVVNELDALVNIDLNTRTEKKEKKVLNFIRIGTSGALQSDIPVDTPVISAMAIGFDGLLNYYAHRNDVTNLEMEAQFKKHLNWNPQLTAPYFVEGSELLMQKIGHDMRKGLTISAPGFYGPQGRVLRLSIQDEAINDKISAFRSNNLSITNYEMECSAIYGLSKLLAHNAVTVCCIIANRMRKEYSKDYKPVIKDLIYKVLQRITE
ncbi:MAG TPA: phosphorylase [Marinilabiliales bacterium]|jgi:uridine phosphorylase|nr:MAG: phosphorylase [Bacteroidetes bacterium GWA2_40_14]OFX57054.1 MAG: phosphorylase [Bacteroidetes bacterium GWC2_40_13]OFX72180.1 MAG: phosphorylase [Bacteroidetes bacterium GWD2_40_43]OFX94246.1 MAG: phosphorylase [Bacteroidetes bacterium GWE2_40_63]OFY23685.1 MAG: phosphorylase [Bacteroidetes bacterium GWF2_40_13]OFZ25240.1 MAG: phosphorylase [Bacteroidetes bacterium RIFOXYC2_FULL_40_12]HAM99300.1 phosphorylase [Marinilabiliales bacterium]